MISWGTKRHLRRGGGKRSLVGQGPWLNDSQAHKSTLSSFWKKHHTHSHFLSLTHMHAQITNHRQCTTSQAQNPHCYRIPLYIIVPTTETLNNLFLTCLLWDVQMYRLQIRNLSSVAEQVLRLLPLAPVCGGGALVWERERHYIDKTCTKLTCQQVKKLWVLLQFFTFFVVYLFPIPSKKEPLTKNLSFTKLKNSLWLPKKQ